LAEPDMVDVGTDTFDFKFLNPNSLKSSARSDKNKKKFKLLKQTITEQEEESEKLLFYNQELI
jgi:hypothetical protein